MRSESDIRSCEATFKAIAQLLEHRTGIAEVMGSNPVETSRFFSGLTLQLLLKLLHNYEDRFHFYLLSAVHIYDLYHTHISGGH